MYTSNLDQVVAAIRQKIADFGFHTLSSTGGGTVGDRAATTVAEGIHERSERQMGPDRRWDDNAPSTIERKGRNSPNFDSGAMLDPKNIAGSVTSTPDTCAIEYTHDEENRRKAEYANFKGQGPRGVIRRFMALDGQINQTVVEVVREELGDHLGQP
jgi:hypothetical protein